MENIIKWKNKVELIKKNLTELNDADFIITIRSNITGLSAITYKGKTLIHAKNNIELLDKLWIDYSSMNEVVNQAFELQNKKGFFKDYTDEINLLLTTPVIKVATENVPLEKRELNTSSEMLLNLSDAQNLMIKQFGEVRDNLIMLRDIESSLQQKIGIINKESQAINEWQKRLGQSFNIDIFKEINELKNDPLEALDSINNYQKTLDNVREKLQNLETVRKEVGNNLQKAKSDLNSLKELIKRNEQVVIETKNTFTQIPSFEESIALSMILSFDTWVDYLQETYNNSPDRLANLVVGVNKCLDGIANILNQEQSIYVKNRVLLDELSDLQGRYNAFNAKAKMKYGNNFDATLRSLKEQAKIALDTKPINIIEVQELVRSFEMALKK